MKLGSGIAFAVQFPWFIFHQTLAQTLTLSSTLTLTLTLALPPTLNLIVSLHFPVTLNYNFDPNYLRVSLEGTILVKLLRHISPLGNSSFLYFAPETTALALVHGQHIALDTVTTHTHALSISCTLVGPAFN